MTERDEALDVYGDNTSVTSERPPSIASTAGASSFDSTGQDQESESVHQSTQSNRPELRRMLSGTSSTSGLTQTETSPPSLGRSQSMTDPSRGANTRRREKTAVGYACLNCKKAHLACDVTRPCRRCVQMGRSSTCTDVPHKRRGRPRLRDSPLISRATLSAISPQRPMIAPGSPVGGAHRRGHSRTGSMNSPYMDFLAPSIANQWGPSSINYSQAASSMQNYPVVQPGLGSPVAPRTGLSKVGMSVGMPEAFRTSTATLFVSVDLKIIRAFTDVQSFFCAAPNMIEGRNLTELCQPEDRIKMPQLMHALQADIHTNRLLLNSHDYRQSLASDLQLYTNTDLSHPFPGAQEHLLGLTFVDAMNRPIPSRMAAVLGSRSNDRFAYAIVSIQRQDQLLTPQTPRSHGTMGSPANFDTGQFTTMPSSDYATMRQAPRSTPSQTSPISQPYVLPHPSPRGLEEALPSTSRAPIGLALNILPPIQQKKPLQTDPRAATSETSEMDSGDPEKPEEPGLDRRSRKSWKRTSISISDMMS